MTHFRLEMSPPRLAIERLLQLLPHFRTFTAVRETNLGQRNRKRASAQDHDADLGGQKPEQTKKTKKSERGGGATQGTQGGSAEPRTTVNIVTAHSHHPRYSPRASDTKRPAREAAHSVSHGGILACPDLYATSVRLPR